MYQPQIIIVPDLILDPISWLPQGKVFVVNKDIDYEEEIFVAPNHKENFLGVVLFEFREECISQKKRIVSFGRANYFSFHALFADEVLIGGGPQPSWYLDDYTGNNTDMDSIGKVKFVDLNKSLKKKVYNYPSNYIANKYWNKPIYIRESSWEIFQKFKEDCPKNVIMCEMKVPGRYMERMDRVSGRLLKINTIMGLSGVFQRGLLERIGYDNYLEFQILASWFLNWVFIAIGGAANLFSLVPVKSILLADDYILEGRKLNIRQLAQKRYGSVGDTFPVVVKSKKDDKIDRALSKCDLEYGFSELSKCPEPEVTMLKVSKIML